MRRVVHVVALLVTSALLSACGGGGGGSSAASGGGTSVTPPSNPTPNLGSQAVQRTDAQAGISALQTYRDNQGGGSGFSSFAIERKVKPALARLDRSAFVSGTRRPMTSSCSNGETTSYVTSGSGVVFTIDVWYDALCTTSIQAQYVWTAAQQGSAVNGPMTLTEYAQSGTVTATGTGQIELLFSDSTLQTLTGIAIVVSDLEKNGQSQGGVGIACYTVSSSGQSCSVAAAVNDYAASVEQGAAVTMSTPQNGAFTMSLDAYQAGLSGLTIGIGTFPNLTMQPSSAKIASLAISGTANSSTGTYTLSMSDSINQGTLTIAGSTSGSATGTLVRNDTGATVASFTLDASGNGTLTYGNGTQVPIVGYAVQG